MALFALDGCKRNNPGFESDSASVDFSSSLLDASAPAPAVDLAVDSAAPLCAVTWKAFSDSTSVADAPLQPLPAPAGIATGDLLLAFIAGGHPAATAMVTVTPPSGWTLLRSLDNGTSEEFVWIFWKVATASEPATYAFTPSQTMISASFISLYGGVDPAMPIDTDAGQVSATAGATFTTPTIATSGADELVVSSLAAHATGVAPTWSTPPGAALRLSFNNTQARSAWSADQLVAAPGTSMSLTSTSSTPENVVITHAVALRPCR